MAGDKVVLETGGGGGWGPPEERSIDLIRRDLTRGYITPVARRATMACASWADRRRTGLGCLAAARPMYIEFMYVKLPVS